MPMQPWNMKIFSVISCRILSAATSLTTSVASFFKDVQLLLCDILNFLYTDDTS